LLVAFAFIAAMTIPIVSIDYYFEWQKSKEEKLQIDRLARLDYLAKDGWSELKNYSASTFRDNYADGEFPIHLSSLSRKADIIEISFRIVNKSAAKLGVTALSEWPYKNEDPRIWEDRNIFSHKVEPRDASNLAIKLYFPKGKKGDAVITFGLTVGSESLLITKRIVVDV